MEVKTDDEGVIHIDGEQINIVMGQLYHLEEIDNPNEHYFPLGEIYHFTLTDDMKNVDYDKFIYFYSDNMQVKNWPYEGLIVQKKLSDELKDTDKDKEFKFRVTLQDNLRNYSGKYGDMQFTNGVAEFTLKSGELKSAYNLPVGTRYIVEEVDNGDVKPSDYEVKWDVEDSTGYEQDTPETHEGSGATSDTIQFLRRYSLVTFTNSKKKEGSLKLKKDAVVNYGTDTATAAKDYADDKTLVDGEYAYTITGPNEVNESLKTTKNVTITIKNGEMTSAKIDDKDATIGQDGYVEVAGLKEGTYTVSESFDTSDIPNVELVAITGGTNPVVKDPEDDSNHVTLTVTSGKEGSEVPAAGMASFTNSTNVGGLKVKKEVVANGGSRTAFSRLAGTYTFGIYTDEACEDNQAYTDKAGNAVTVSIKIDEDGQAKESQEIKNLPAGDYWIKEIPNTDASKNPLDSPTPETNPIPVTIEAGKTGDTAVVKTFKNVQNYGALKIKKDVLVNMIAATQTGEFETTTAADGEYRFQLRKDDPNSGNVASLRIWIENGVIAKDHPGAEAGQAHYPKIYTRTVIPGIEKSGGGWYIYHVEPDADGYVTIPDLEPGTYYVKEVEGKGVMEDDTISLYSSQINNEDPVYAQNPDGTTNPDANNLRVEVVAGEVAEIPAITFTNNKTETGELDISKKVLSDSIPLYVNTEFTFTIDLFKDANRSEKSDFTGTVSGVTFIDGTGTVTVKHNETKNIGGIPTGLYYRITENDAPGFEVAGITVSSEAPSDQTSQGSATGIIRKVKKSAVEFKNQRDEGNLKVNKIVSSTYTPDHSKKFKFTVTLNGSTLNGTYGQMNFENGVAKFELADTESATAEKLPAGINYTVTEEDEDGFTHTWSGNTSKTEGQTTTTTEKDAASANTGTIAKNTTDTVTATNTRIYGGLTISKRVISSDTGDQDKEFKFTVTLDDTTINGTYGDMEFKKGVATVTVKPGDTNAKTTGETLPYGLAYTVTEESVPGFTLAGHTNDTGTITSGIKIAGFTNSKNQGGLLIYKHISSPVSTDLGKKFSFRVEKVDAQGNIDTAFNKTVKDDQEHDIAFVNGVTTTPIELGFDQTIIINDLEVDTQYRVVEVLTPEDDANFTTAVSKGTGSSSTEAVSIVADKISDTRLSSARFTNTRTPGNLTLSKELISDVAADANQQFTFTVNLTLPDSATFAAGTYGGMSFDATGKATVKITGGQSVTANNLPVGIPYTITEASATGFELKGITVDGTTKDAAAGVISATPSTVKFTNEREKGNLKLSKELISDRAADGDQDFTFTVTLSDKSITKTFGGMAFTEGVATVKVKGGKSVEATGLPTGITYTITEANAPGFQLTGIVVDENDQTASGQAAGAITKGATSNAKFTNERVTGKLTINKRVISDTELDKAKTFNYTITLSDTSINGDTAKNGKPFGATFTDGVAHVSITTADYNGSVTIDNLPVDITYAITEDNAPGFKLQGSTDPRRGTISASPTTVAFVNEREKGDLDISKKVISAAAADADTVFNFHVTLYDNDSAEKKVDTSIAGKYGDVTFTAGEADFQLKKDQIKHITGLPTGLYYEVTEAEADGFRLTGKTGDTGTITTTKSTATFTNTRDEGGLKITKKVESNTPADRQKEFTFTVKLIGAPVTGAFEKVDATDTKGISFNNGTATVTLKDGEIASAKGLPIGVEFTVVEADTIGFYNTSQITTVSGKTEEVAHAIATDVPVVEFTNHREEGNLEVSKTVTSNYAPDKDTENMKFNFRVELSDKTINGTYGGMAFTNGVATFQLGDTEVLKAEGLPANITYTVTETTVGGFGLMWSGNTSNSEKNTGTIATNQTATVNANNRRLPGKLNVTKLVSSHTDADYGMKFPFQLTFYTDAAMTKQASELTGTYKIGNSSSTFNRGWLSFGLAHNETLSMENLPIGLYYKVEEITPEGFVLTKMGDTGQISTEQTARFTNVRSEGGLYVTKEVKSHLQSDKDKKYTFNVKIYKDSEMKTIDESVDGTYNGDSNGANALTFEKGVAKNVTLSDGEVAFAQGLPEGDYYRVEEVTPEGLTVSLGEGTITREQDGSVYYTTGRIANAQNQTLAFINTRNGGNLEVSKLIKDAEGKDLSDETTFSVIVELEDKTINGTFGDMVFVDGYARFTIANGQTVSTADKNFTEADDEYYTLPAGMKYKVTEQHGDGYITSWTNTTKANNNRETTYSYAFDQEWEEESSSGIGTLYKPKSESRTISWTDDAGTHKSTKTQDLRYEAYDYEGVPEGDIISWTKEDVSTEWSWNEDGTGTAHHTELTNHNTDNVTFTNSPVLGDLAVTKKVVSPFTSDSEKTFHFTVELEDTTINGKYGDMEFTNGKAEFDLHDGQTYYARGLPKYLRYVVNEQSDAEFEIMNGDEARGRIGYTDIVTEGINKRYQHRDAQGNEIMEGRYNKIYENDRNAGWVGAVKHVRGTNVNPDQEFKFRITLYTDAAMQHVAEEFSSYVCPVLYDEEDGYWQVQEYDTKNGITFTNGVSEVFTLKDGEERHFGNRNITIDETGKVQYGIPSGLTYRVEELDADGYTTTWVGQTGAIGTENGYQQDVPGATATATNTRIEGGLTVSKKLVSDRDADKNAEFRFTVQLTIPAGTSFTAGTYGDMTFDTTGKATFDLKGGEHVTATGLPNGLGYTVDEVGIVKTDADGTETVDTATTGFVKGFTDDKNTGTITENKTELVEAVNTREKGNLSVSKKLLSDREYDKSVQFNFTVTLSDTTINGRYGDMIFINGVANVPVKGGETFTASGLPTDIGYTVTERDIAEFKQMGTTIKEGDAEAKSGNSGTIKKDTTSLVTIENWGRRGSVTVSKEVISDFAPDKTSSQKFNFTIELSDKSINGEMSFDDQPYGVTFTNGVAKFDVAHNESMTIAYLPVNVTYAITEANTPGFTLTGRSGYTGTITSSKPLEAKFTNTRETGDLEISKTLISSDSGDEGKGFIFNIQLYTDATKTKSAQIEAKTYGDISFNGNGVATVEIPGRLKSPVSMVATGLPTGLYYVVTESSVENFTLTSKTGDEGVISTTKSTASFTNTHLDGGLQIYKYVMSPSATDRNKLYHFRVTLENTAIDTSNVSGATFTNGVADVYARHDQTITITGLPTGTKFTVEEILSDEEKAEFETKYAVNGGNAEPGTITTNAIEIPSQSNAYVRFSNEHKTGGLKLKKELVSDRAGDANREFTFTVTLKDSGINGTFKPEGTTSTAKPITFTNGTAIVTLKKGESAEAQGLPLGMEYTIAETGVTGFNVENPTRTGTITEKAATQELAANTVEETFTNKRDTGNLVLKKLVNGPSDENKEFKFKVTLNDKTIGGADGKTYEKVDANDIGMTFKNGVAEVTLKANQTASAKGLPVDTYAIVETADSSYGYTVTSTNSAGSITKDTTITSEFTNTRDVTEASIKKVWDKNGQTVDLPAGLTVQLLADGQPFGNLHTLQPNEQDPNKDWMETVTNLPRFNTTNGNEIVYTWRETNLPEGWTLSGESKVGTLTSITNTYNHGTLKLSGHKTITNKPATMDLSGYKFTVKEGDTTVATGTSDADGNIAFTEIAYSAEGKHVYKVTEDASPTKEGVTNSTDTVQVNVTVTNDGKGNLVATADNNSPAAIYAVNFTNTYDATGAARLRALKVANPTLGDRKFKFQLFDVAGKLLQTSNEVTSGQAALFDVMTYELSDLGTATSRDFTYQIREVIPSDAKIVNGRPVKDGVTYDASSHNVTVTVTNNGHGGLDIKYDGNAEFTTMPTFANNYAATAELPLSGTKIMDGRDFQEGDEYTFTVTSEERTAPLPTNATVTIRPTSGTTAALDFGSIPFTLDDAGKTYTYKVTETGTVDGVAIAAAQTFSVTVTDNGNGTLKITEGSNEITSKALSFTNKFTPVVKGIQVTKVANDWGDINQFDFALTAGTNDAGVATPMPAGAIGTTANASATKTNPLASFGNITFTKAGTYNYVIREIMGTADGMTYDTTGLSAANAAGHPVKVVVTRDQLTNALSAEVKYGATEANALTITNQYDSSKASVQATKVFDDWSKFGGLTFEFTLAAGANDAGVVTPMPAEALSSVTPTQLVKTASMRNPVVNFGDMDYRKAGTYHYTVTETKGTAPGVTYDTTAHPVTVTVTKGADNKLTTSVAYDDAASSLAITNEFTPVTAQLEATKNFKVWGAAKSFTFDLAAVSAKDVQGDDIVSGVPLPTTESGTVATVIESSPVARFGEIKFEEPGTYTYNITERNDHVKGVTYDETDHVAVVTVTQNATTNALEASVAYDNTNPQLIVTNTYTPDKPSFDKKIKDTNDTTGETSDWQDSADYDIGDAVPYKLAATLASDVTAYKKYHVTFTDKMEESLDYNKDAQITVTGADGKVIDPATYTVEKVAENDHDFAYKVSWAGAEGATIADANLNGAKVEVLFTATLNEKAKLGKEGNVNACKLAYSNNPASADDSDEGELPWDYVIAFTYKLDVSKVDQNAKALEGAEFKLEKKLADGTTKEFVLSTAGNVFTGVGLDDGIYVLTETKAPAGYMVVNPIEFTVSADHNAAWDYTSDATKDPVFDNDGQAGSKRLEILTALTGDEKTGALELKADEQLAGLAGNVVNQPETSPGSLAVRKVVVSTRSEDRTKNYGFRVTLYNDSARSKVATDVNGTYGDMTFTNGVAMFTLTASESKTAKSLPFNDENELYYMVEETDAGGLTPKLTESKASNGQSATVVCTNTYTAPRTTTTTPRTTTSTSLAKTSDDTNWIPVALLAVAGVGIVAFAILRRRNQQ